MQEYLAKEGRMYKALLYSTFDEFLERLEGETISIVDWDCKQGIAVALLLDFIREKQLDIKVSDVILLDKDSQALSRAMLHVDVMKQEKLKIKASDSIAKKKTKNKNITINLIANETLHVKPSKANSSLFLDAYTVCVSNKSDELLESVYNQIDALVGVDETILDEETKIGRFKKFAIVFKTDAS